MIWKKRKIYPFHGTWFCVPKGRRQEQTKGPAGYTVPCPDGNRVKVENVKWSNVNADSSTFFCCEVMDGEYVREFVLVSIYSQHRWYLDTKKRKAFVTRKKGPAEASPC